MFSKKMEEHYKKGEFNKLKSVLANLNELNIDYKINFWNNEYVAFLRHYSMLFESKQLSQCSSSACPKGNHVIVNKECLTWRGSCNIS